MSARLERILIETARHYAPHLVPPGWRQPGDYHASLAGLVNALAEEELLIVELLPLRGAAYDPNSLGAWLNIIHQLYLLMASRVFGDTSQFTAFDADQIPPPVVILRPPNHAVTLALGQFILPYLSLRRHLRPVPDIELHGVMELALVHIEADDMDRSEYMRLRSECVGWLRQALAHPLVTSTLLFPHITLADQFVHLAETPGTQDLDVPFPGLNDVRMEPPMDTDTMPSAPMPPPMSAPPPPPPDTLPDEVPTGSTSASHKTSRVPSFTRGLKRFDHPDDGDTTSSFPIPDLPPK